jgi:LuxR family maltose regulon positive regulatory protein
MSTPILATKLYIPSLRPDAVSRFRLIERLNEGLRHNRKLTLIAAPAGFGKTTLVSAWVAVCDRKTAWLSLDEADSDPTRFLTYFVAALKKIEPHIGDGVLGMLQSPQPPPTEAVLTALLNEIAAIQDSFVLILDDYHLIEARVVDDALAFLLEHLPPQMHLVIATREDPPLPLPRLRARDQLTELRVTDLRFTPSEAAGFLKEVMGLDLSAGDVTALEARTEGWIAGLQLAALSMQGHQDATNFIQSFTGSSRFIIDYLAEEVLERQDAEVRAFLLRTSLLERMCAPLCDAVLNTSSAGFSQPLISSQAMLEKLERSNLFIVPLDNERGWYRYHHLFADLLRQRLRQGVASSPGDAIESIAELHKRASQWYEDSGLELEALHHAAAASDVARAGRIIEGKGVPLHFRGGSTPVLNWLKSLPATVLDTRPSLWVTYASALAMTGQPIKSVEEKLRAAEAVLQEDTEPDDKNRNLIGQIAAIRAMLAVPTHQVKTILVQSRRALEFLHPDNLSVRTTTTWTLGYAYQVQGNRAEASQAFTEAISISHSSGDIFNTILATGSLGQVQEAQNQLYLAAATYQRVLQLAGDPPQTIACEAFLGLARIYYEWNDLEAAERYGQQCFQLTRQLKSVDNFASYGVFLTRLRLAQGDVAGAITILDEDEEFVRQHNFVFRMSDVAAAKVLTLLRQGQVAVAARLAQSHDLPLSQARVHLALGNPVLALAVLEPFRQKAEAKNWTDERLKVMVLQAVALHSKGETGQAVQLLGDTLVLAEPGGCIRIFVDEGPIMAALLREAAKHDTAPDYVRQLRAAFGKGKSSTTPNTQLLIEPLSERELEVLRLLGTELSGPEIARELMVSVNTMYTHTKNIYSKLSVNDRRAATRRAEELGLL